MNDKWLQMPFEQRHTLLNDMDANDLRKTYDLTDAEYKTARAGLNSLPVVPPRRKLKLYSASPDKRSLREASRDFNLTLIFAELIDNSIDRFCKESPSSGDELRITIVFDRVLSTCVYEDNAGGFEKDNVVNFFRPGGTDNDTTSHSIGSYAWGAKKARSALADSVDLVSRGKSGKAILATIDSDWDLRDDDWNIRIGHEGDDFTLPAKAKINAKHTRLVFKNLKPLINTSAAALQHLRQDLGELYALYLNKHPDCPYQFDLNIQVQNQAVTGNYDYRWTGYAEEDTDLRPRKFAVTRQVTLPFATVADGNETQDVSLVLEIGIKQDTGCATHGVDSSSLFDTTDDWGIDVYGNGRLIERNVRQALGLSEILVGQQQAAKLVKGRLLIRGSSYAVPWDTHKTRVAPNHPTLAVVNEELAQVVQGFAKAAKTAGRGTKAISTKLLPNPWNKKWHATSTKGKTLSLSFDLNTAPIGATSNAGFELPSARRESTKGKKGLRTISFKVTMQEQNDLCRWLHVDEKGLPDAIKKKILRVAATRQEPGRGQAIDTQAFTRLRAAIRDPRILAKLQAAGLRSMNAIRSAGERGLMDAGLEANQVAVVLGAID